MAIYQKTIRGNSNATTSAAMTSWHENCIAFINQSTSLGVSYTVSSQATGSTGFVVTVPIASSYLQKFGIMMSVSTGTANYFSNVIHNNVVYPIGEYGNCFDYTLYYEAKVLILHNDDTLRVIIDFDGSYHTMINLNKATELSGGREFWGCTGFIPTSLTAYTLEDLTPHRNSAGTDGALSGDIRIANATTKSGRYQINNLYSYYLPSVVELPEFIPFNVSFSDGNSGTAVILNKCVVKNSSGTSFGDGKYLLFVDNIHVN